MDFQLSVGNLHAIGEFCNFINDKEISYNDIRDYSRGVVRHHTFEEVFSFSQHLNLIEISIDNRLLLSKRGKLIGEAYPNSSVYLPLLLEFVIKDFTPQWSGLMTSGPDDFLKLIKKSDKDLYQIFEEGELLTNLSMKWWDKITDYLTGEIDNQNTEIGRFGEELTLKYEHVRTGAKPFWISQGTNYVGYDILSRVSKKNPRILSIEVKASVRNLEDACFYFTRNEFEKGLDIEFFLIYLWLLDRTSAELCIIDLKELSKHTSKNIGCGHWEKVSFPFEYFFKKFKTEKVQISKLGMKYPF